MGNHYFEFRHFIVHQDHCGMKVGTDGTLLGAWARMGSQGTRVLDIGTGTGLIALMMAQRFAEASITAIDIDPAAVTQARRNAGDSPFADRITVMEADIADFNDEGLFDAIVSNPPYFNDSLQSPDAQRTIARHTASLSYSTLISSAYRLLADDGMLSVIIPDNFRECLMAEAHLRGFFLTRQFAVRTSPRKLPKRYLIELMKHPVGEIDKQEVIIELSPGQRSPWYQQLTADFYIK